jgi:hypothetical protein
MAPRRLDDELELPDINLNDFSDNFECYKWNEAFIADAKAEVVEEEAEWGAEQELLAKRVVPRAKPRFHTMSKEAPRLWN